MATQLPNAPSESAEASKAYIEAIKQAIQDLASKSEAAPGNRKPYRATRPAD
jgi:hypothetical protein